MSSWQLTLAITHYHTNHIISYHITHHTKSHSFALDPSVTPHCKEGNVSEHQGGSEGSCDSVSSRVAAERTPLPYSMFVLNLDELQSAHAGGIRKACLQHHWITEINAHASIWECVQDRLQRGSLHSLSNTDQYSGSGTNVGIWGTIYIQTALCPLMEGSFIRALRLKYIRQMVFHRADST